jgi:hypothetical protein
LKNVNIIEFLQSIYCHDPTPNLILQKLHNFYILIGVPFLGVFGLIFQWKML